MEQLPQLLLLVVIFVLWLFVVVLKIRSWTGLKNFLHSHTTAGKAEVVNEFTSILTTYSPFFNHLSPEGKKHFISRCILFVADKRFIGMEGLKVTHEMQIRVAGTAVQVTYGLKNSAFSHYHTVKIFPESFYSRLHDNYLKGGASTGGVLYFSWKDFEMGFADPADRYNLGLHEMAHALRLQLRHGNDFDIRFASYTDHWMEMALPEFERMNEGKTSFLREYGGSNIEEFFAVCIEHFFEVPFEFKKQLPDIYNHLCFLLNLDPTRIHDDYRLPPGFVESVNEDKTRMPLPLKLTRAYQYDNWHWSFNVVVAGLFAGIPAIFIFYGMVLFKGLHVVLIFVTVTAIIMFFKNFLMQKGIGLFHHLLLFSIAGAGPLSTALFLASNYYIKSDYTSRAYRVTHAQKIIKQEADGLRAYYLLTLENNAFDAYSDIRTIHAGVIGREDFEKPVYLTINTTTGLWGLENFEDKALMILEKPGNSD